MIVFLVTSGLVTVDVLFSVYCLLVWLLLKFLSSFHFARGVESIVGWIVRPGDRFIVRAMICRADLHVNGASNQLWGLVWLYIWKGLSLIEVTVSICEHMYLHTDSTGDRTCSAVHVFQLSYPKIPRSGVLIMGECLNCRIFL
jgi:hypothetical protein